MSEASLGRDLPRMEATMIFGKPFSAYVRFQRGLLLLTLVVGLLRLGLSLAGVPNSKAKWLSVTVVLLASVFYYGVRVHTSGFGSYTAPPAAGVDPERAGSRRS